MGRFSPTWLIFIFPFHDEREDSAGHYTISTHSIVSYSRVESTSVSNLIQVIKLRTASLFSLSLSSDRDDYDKRSSSVVHRLCPLAPLRVHSNS
jgi:hypothetical protein